MWQHQLGGLGDDPLGELEIFAGMASPEPLEQRLRDEVGTEVAAMLDAIREFDAFDVIELMRLREIPVVPVLALEADFDGMGAAIDLVSLVCLSRPGRMLGGNARELTEPHRVIDDLHVRATRLLRLAQFMHSRVCHARRRRSAGAPGIGVPVVLVGVRNLRYESLKPSMTPRFSAGLTSAPSCGSISGLRSASSRPSGQPSRSDTAVPSRACGTRPAASSCDARLMGEIPQRMRSGHFASQCRP